MVTKALLEVSIEGLGKIHKTSIFPCGIFSCKEGVNRKPGDPNYDLFLKALESTATRLYPNYANCDVNMQKDWIKYDREQKEKYINSLSQDEKEILRNKLKLNPELQDILMIDSSLKVKQDELPIELMSTMGCRTQNGADVNAIKSYEKNVQAVIHNQPLYDDFRSAAQKDGRGNICPCTIILPTIAMEAKEKVEAFAKLSNSEVSGYNLIDEFMTLLDEAIHDAKDMLLERFNWICSQSPAAAKFMYENHTMAGYNPADGIRSALVHGTLALGQLGLAECLQILVGCDHTEPKGMKLAKQIEQLFKDRCAEFKAEYSLNFGVYYTPAENLCYTAMNKFKATYGEIPNVSDRDYFSNSMHVPVWHQISPFDKIDIECQLTGYSNAGCITYVELPSGMKNNIKALEILVNYAMDHDIGYFALNVPCDTCLDCGYTNEFNNKCPVCGSTNIQRLRRVTGYLTGNYTTAFNKGKISETEDRVKHVGILEK